MLKVAWKFSVALLIAFLLLMSQVGLQPQTLRYSEQLTRASAQHATLVEQDSSEPKNLDFQGLKRFIEEFKSDLNSFALKEGGDGYANSTFYAYLTLALLGASDRINWDEAKRYLEYLYNEESGGFREWLGGNETVEATAYCLLITHIFGIELEGFSEGKTVNFILKALNESESNLKELSLGLISLILLNYSDVSDLLTKLESTLEAEIAQESANVEEVFLALKALALAGANLSGISDKVVGYLLSLEEDGGFGSVFYTGLVLETLTMLGCKNDTLFEEAEKYVNASWSPPELLNKPNGTKGTVFDAFGAVLTFYASGKIVESLRIEHKMLPAEQIPIDYNETISFILDIKGILGEFTLLEGKYRVITRNVTGGLFYLRGVGYKANLPYNASFYGFGNHTVEVELTTSLYILKPQTRTYELSFRVGYNITVSPEAPRVTPNGTLEIRVDVKFFNGTPVNSGMLYVSIAHELNGTLIIYNLTEHPGGVNITFTVPERPLLGFYEIVAYVNDSHGYNHSVAKSEFEVYDKVKFSLKWDNGNRSLGSWVEFLVLANYSINNLSVISGVGGKNLTLEAYILSGGENFSLTAKWLADGVIWVGGHLPTVLPEEMEFEVFVGIKFDSRTFRSGRVAKYKFDLSDLTVTLATTERITAGIGDVVRLNATLVAKESGETITNGTFEATIKSPVPQNITLEWNSTLQVYVAEFEIDPNIPPGNYMLDFFKSYENETVTLNAAVEYTIEVAGYPSIAEYRITAGGIVGRETIVKFVVVRNGSDVKLSGLNLTAIISHEEEKVANVTVTDAGNGTYEIGFIPDEEGEYNISVFRATDGYLLGNISIVIKKLEEKVTTRLAEIAPKVLIGAAFASLVAYACVYYIMTKKIPRRFLYGKRKRFTP